MPKATASIETTKFDLESCPGGWVELRRLTYGEMLKRRDMSTKFTGVGDKNKTDVDVSLDQTSVVAYEFRNAIIEHNLEDEEGNKLNFSNATDISRMDPRIAGEIEDHINEMNQPPDRDAQKSLGVSRS